MPNIEISLFCFVSPPLRAAEGGLNVRSAFVSYLFICIFNYSVWPIISTSTGPIFTKFALLVDERWL